MQRLAVASAIALSAGLALAHGLLLLSQLAGRDLPWALLGALAGALCADAITGLVHWACDTWGDERTPLVGPLIRSFREHHRDPGAMLRHDWTFVNREPALAAGAALALLWLAPLQQALAPHPAWRAGLLALCVYGGAANQLHCWAHAAAPPRAVRALQRAGLVLAPARHAHHHRAPRTRAYCIATGWLDPALDALRVWRGLERGVTRLTGVRARRGAANG